MPTNPDHILIREKLAQVAAGDEKAFAALFYEFHQQLGDYLMAITHSREVTKEIVQEAFVKIWMMRERLPQIENFNAWLFRICRNKAYNVLRDQALHNTLLVNYSKQQPDTDYTLPHKQEQHYRLIEKAVEQLPDQQKTAYTLSRSAGLTHEQIAQQMGISKATVKRHIHLALQSIASFLRLHAGDTFVVLLVDLLF